MAKNRAKQIGSLNISNYESLNRVYSPEASSPVLSTCGGGQREVKIALNNKKPQVIGGLGEKKSNGGTQYYLQDRIYDGEIATTTTTHEQFQPYYAVAQRGRENGQQFEVSNREAANALTTVQKDSMVGENLDSLRIRKLTPKECFRLMGVKDAETDKLGNLANSTLYHLAGDSIVTTVLMAIFGELLEVEWKDKVNNLHECARRTSE